MTFWAAKVRFRSAYHGLSGRLTSPHDNYCEPRLRVDALPGDRMNKRDRQLGMDRSITRRDFLNGVRIAIGGAIVTSALPGLELAAETSESFAQDQPGYYPPALTGIRGNHDGTFTYAHQLRDGKRWDSAGAPAASTCTTTSPASVNLIALPTRFKST